MNVTLQFKHAKYSDEALNESLSEILNNTTLLAMASIKGTESYINTAYYCYNESLDFFILTEPFKQHSQNVNQNHSVALAIYDSHQPWEGDKRGIQVFGECEMASGRVLEEAINLYNQRFPGLKQWIQKPEDFDKGIINSRFYIIKPKSIKLFDEVKFGKDNYISLGINQ